jgi:hypothetical protein
MNLVEFLPKLVFRVGEIVNALTKNVGPDLVVG